MNHYDPPGRFTQCPAYIPGETAQGYLGRLTAFFGAKNPKHFCRDFLLDLKGIQYGEPEALRRLAAMTGADAETVIRSTPRRLSQAYMEINGETLHTRVNARHHIRLCPLCAKEYVAAAPGMPIDQAVPQRCEWTVGAIDACHRHNVRLVTHVADRRKPLIRLDAGYEVVNLLEELDLLPVEHAAPDEFQLYILSRIGIIDRRPSPLLDPLPLINVAQLCHAAGHDVLKRRGCKSEPLPIERRAAGFEFLGHGVEQMERLVVEMRQGLRLSEMASRLMPRLLEYLHEAAKLERGLDDFVDVLADICFRNLPYAKGQILLGRPCPERTYFDYPSALAEFELGTHHLAAFILGTPELTVQRGSKIQDAIIRADVAERLFRGRTPFLSGEETLRAIGCSDATPGRDVEYLTMVGILVPEAGASMQRTTKFYSAPDTSASLERFISGFELVDPEGMEDIYTLGTTNRTPQSAIWQVIGEGKVKKMGLVDGAHRVDAMRFDPMEIRRAITGLKEPMTAFEVAERLLTSTLNIRKLVSVGALMATDQSTNFPVGLTPLFEKQTIDAFDADFISVKAIGRIVGSRVPVSQLEKIGLVPAISHRDEERRNRAIFYRRDDVMKIIGQLTV